MHTIPTGVTGPIYHKDSTIGALVIGRSSAGTAGLIVLPGVIDADYTGEIMIAAYTLTPPLVINKGTRLAQLVLYTRAKECGESPSAPSRGTRGFGSTGQTLVNLVQRMQQRPMVAVQLHCKDVVCSVSAMMDTGADVTIIDKKIWPKTWTLVPSVDSVQGVGGGSSPMQSNGIVQMVFPEGQRITVKPYVMNLPGDLGGLIGRDVLTQLGATLHVPRQGF